MRACVCVYVYTCALDWLSFFYNLTLFLKTYVYKPFRKKQEEIKGKLKVQNRGSCDSLKEYIKVDFIINSDEKMEREREQK